MTAIVDRPVSATDRLGTTVSPPVVRDWLEELGLLLLKIEKSLEGDESPELL